MSDMQTTISPPSGQPTKADPLERAKSAATIFASVVLPIILLFVGNQFTAAIKEREVEGKFVELAVSILKEQPDKQSRNLRDWATQVITKYSRVALSPEATRDLIETTTLPGLAAGVSEAQTMLAVLGYYDGAVDGQEGMMFRSAVQKFQQDNGLPTDGRMGPATLSVLIQKYKALKK